jgi:hypothetical protein
MQTKKKRKEKFKELRKHFTKWQEMQVEVHTLSPCHPLKVKHKEHAKEWKRIIKDDPELFEMIQEIEEFEDIFSENAS